MHTRTAPQVLSVVRPGWRNVTAKDFDGFPSPAIARRWQKVRRALTVELERRVAENVN